MSTPTYFVQECPTCGRRLEVRVEYLGKRVVCQHCHGKFVASNEPNAEELSESGILLRRAEELLQLATSRQAAANQQTRAAS